MQTHFNLTLTGQHFFQNVNGAAAPVWDLRSVGPFTGNGGAFIVTRKVKSVASPDSPTDIAWLELDGFEGELGTKVYRTNTAGGQPASTVSSSVVPILFSQRNTFLV